MEVIQRSYHLFNVKYPPWLKASLSPLSLESLDECSHLLALEGSELFSFYSSPSGRYFEWPQSRQGTVDPLRWGASRRISRLWAVYGRGNKQCEHRNTKQKSAAWKNSLTIEEKGNEGFSVGGTWLKESWNVSFARWTAASFSTLCPWRAQQRGVWW